MCLYNISQLSLCRSPNVELFVAIAFNPTVLEPVALIIHTSFECSTQHLNVALGGKQEHLILVVNDCHLFVPKLKERGEIKI